MLLSSGDGRFNQFVTCLNILFDCPIDALLREYEEIKVMTLITKKIREVYTAANFKPIVRSPINLTRVSDFSNANTRIGQKCLMNFIYAKLSNNQIC